MRRVGLGLCCTLAAAQYLVPATLLHAAGPDGSGWPKGEVAKYVFDQSRIFPGTVRNYWIYVPKQYDPAKPACLYVNQDGVQYKAPEVFDELIHKKEMPVTIGVFVTPGRMKALSPQWLDRFNRSFEYDGLGDGYVRFLLEELLPEVEKKTTLDGRPIRLSRDGNDRCIGGASSGAICAFTAAWERPDAFRRVFSAIGTYVGLRGGNDYPTLIRKYEPKPIRIFLQDGSSDLNIYGGDWWMANQEMERALRFSGYEVNHDWGTGGHNGEHATRIFPDAMRWLWKDWPAPVKAGEGSPQLREILVPNENWTPGDDRPRARTGLAANAEGEVYFVDNHENKIYKLGLDGKITLFASDADQCQSLAFGPDGRLYAASLAHDRLVAFDSAGRSSMIRAGLGRNYELVAGHDGGIYLTPGWGGGAVTAMFRVTPKGDARTLEGVPNFASGVALSPDQSLLYVADHNSHWVYSFQIQADGSLKNKQRFFHLHEPDSVDESRADGLQVDRDGRLYVATQMGIQVCDQTGRVNCIIPTPKGAASKICFGGDDFRYLFATSGGQLFRRKLKVKGAPAFEPPFKPAAPRL